MITFSTYTEPAAVPRVNESPQVETLQKESEVEENQEAGEFAEILAGMLNATAETEIEVPVPEEGFAAGEIDICIEEIEIKESNFWQPAELQEAEIFANEFTENEVTEGLFAEDLFAQTAPVNDQIIDEESILSDIAGLKANLPDADADAAVHDGLSASVAALESAQELTDTKIEKKELQKETSSKIDEKPAAALFDAKQVQAGEEKTAAKHDFAQDQDPKKQKLSRLEEARTRKDKVTFEVHDMRTQQGVEKINAGMEIRRVEAVPVQELTLELRLPSEGQGSAQSAWEVKAGTALENMLARELHQNFNGDIVRHASMALKDGGDAVIRLALKPDTLGNVKILLKMTENKMTGHIVVESKEALNAFQKELDSLEQAFLEAGFEAINLEVSLSSQGNEQEGENPSSFIPQSVVAQYENSSASMVDVFFGHKQSTVCL